MVQEVFQLAFIGPGGPEFLVVMLVLLLMFGAKDAPRVFRKINEIIDQIRSAADGFKREVMYGDLINDPAPDETPDTMEEFMDPEEDPAEAAEDAEEKAASEADAGGPPEEGDAEKA